MTVTQITLSLILLIAAIGMIVLLPAVRNFITKRFSLLFALVFIFGLIVYTIGYYKTEGENLVASAFLSLTSTIQMFLLASDLYVLPTDPACASPSFVMAFAIVHILALIMSVTFVLDLFGRRIVSRIEMYFIGIGTKTRPLCILGGTDKNSLALAQSLIDDPKVVDPLIVFINCVEGDSNQSFSLENMLDSSKSKNPSEKAEKMGHVINTTSTLSEIMADPKHWLFKSIERSLRFNEDSRIFLLSADSKENTAAALCLAEILGSETKTIIYVGTHPNSPDAHRLADYDYVRMVSKSNLTVCDLLDDTPLLTQGKSKPTLIVGFGHTGKAALLALVENGFTEIDVTSFSKDMRKEEFLCFNPQLRDNDKIRIMDLVANSDSYWKYLRENIDRLCNVIVFTQEDSQSYKAGSRILEYAKTARKDMNDFRVYIMTPQSEIIPKEKCMYTFGEIESTYNFKMF